MQVLVEGFRLSRQQERLWLLQRGSRAYRTQCALLIEGSLSEQTLQAALQKVISDHEILRTNFHQRPGLALPLQIISDSTAPSWRRIDLTGDSAQEQEATIDEIFTEDGRAFELEQDQLLRVSLLLLSAHRRVLIITLPSLCADKQTIRHLIYELSRVLAGTNAGSDEPLQYADFCEWENELLESEDAEIGKGYWQGRDLVAAAGLTLPFEIRQRRAPAFEPAHLHSLIDQWTSDRLRIVARDYQTSPANFLLACWQTLLWRLTAQPDIIVGNLSDGRKHDDASDALGLFAKWLPIRCHFEESFKFSEILTQIQETTRDAHEWQEYFNWEPAANGSAPDFFATGFEYDQWPSKYHAGGLTFSILRQYICLDRFKIKLRGIERDDTLAIEFCYDSELMSAAAIKCLSGQFAKLLQSAVTHPETAIGELEILDEVERRRLLVEFNETKQASPTACVHELFEQQAARTPDRIAVVFEDQQLSFHELNRRANQLAHYLISLGVGPEIPVAIAVDRSLEMIVGMLAVLKAGGAYVPLEVVQPQERLNHILEDIQPPVILTQQRLAGGLSWRDARVICLDEDVPAGNSENPESRATVDNLVYVIFTSGSTGKPKGVAIEHRQLINYVASVNERLEFPDGGSYATVSMFAADLGNTMIFPSLCFGGTLHVIAQEVTRDPVALASYFSQYPIDCLKIVPSHLESLLMSPEPEKILPRQRLVLGGEATRSEMVAMIEKLAPECRVYNHYGPTETTVGVLTYRSPEAADNSEPTGFLPLGRPLPNSEIYLLDGRQQPVPQGALGEVFVGGHGLARAYWQAPELTAEKFIPNPFSAEPGTRLYKTGDLARHRMDGNLEFAGRADNQIKFHGFRVELNEIRTALNKHTQIRDSIIVLTKDEDGTSLLVAYYVARRELESAQLREFLSEFILAETIPNAFIHLKRLPLTLNGKINYQALPLPAHVQPTVDRPLVLPGTPAEVILADIWRQILRLEKISIHDNFFELGGDSILCIQIIGRANQAGLRFTPQQLFQHQTIAELAAVASPSNTINAEQGTVTGEVPLLPIQRWFFEKELPAPHHWNQAMVLELRQEIDRDTLEKVFHRLIAHHDALRLRFMTSDGRWRQVNVGDETGFSLLHVDLSVLPEAEQAIVMDHKIAELHASLDLSNGPLLRACIFDFGPDKASRLHIIIHHLAVDGVSWRILLEDLETTYIQLSSGQTVAALPSKTSSFKEWAIGLTKYAGTSEVERESAYWLNRSAASIPRLPVDSTAGHQTEASARTVIGLLSEQETLALLQDIPAVHHTQINDVLLAAVAVCISEWSGNRSLFVDMEGHGREAVLDRFDLSRTVGWFTTHFPVLINLDTAWRIEQALPVVKDELRAIPNHGIGYGLLRYLGPNQGIIEKLRAEPHPEVSFNYLGQFDQVFAESKLFTIRQDFDGPIRSPLGKRSHLLEINAAVIAGQLHTVWIYSEGIHQRATIERLSDAFNATLRSLITYRPEPGAAESYTLTDFPLAEIDEQEFSKLSLLLEEVDAS